MADVELDVTFESSNENLDVDFGSVYVIDGDTAVKVIANKYSSERTYAVGEYVIQESLLYRCITAIDEPEEFDSEKWLNIKLADDVQSVKSAIDTLSGVVDGKADSTDVTSALANKLDKANPTGTGSLSLNRKPGDVGNRSVAVGDGNTASGYASFAGGRSTVANHRSQHVFGEFNTPDDSTVSSSGRGNYIEIIGNGTGIRERSNARILDWSGNETLAGDLTFNRNKSLTSEISRLDRRIDNLPAPMVFKGTLGTGGTIEVLPVASDYNEGWTYKVITDGTYAGQTAKVGDAFISNGSEWVYIPSGDEDNDTWRNIKVNGTEVLGNGISSGAVDFEDTTNVKFEFDANGNKVRARLDGIYTNSEVDDLLDDKADKSTTYTKAQVDDIVYNILPDDTASGGVANFETDLALPIKSLEVDVNAVQKSGTPTPASPLPISGWSKISLAKCGDNLVDVKPFSDWVAVRSSYYVLRSCVPNAVINVSLIDKDVSVDLSGISFGFVDSKWDGTEQITTREYRWVVQNGAPQTNKKNTAIGDASIILTGLIFYPQTEETYNKIMARYNLEFEIDVAAFFKPYNGNTEVINLGGTYYGGHFTQDKAGHRQFEVTHNYIASYNGEAINEPWISSMDAYSQGATPTTGAQVVYPLGTSYVIALPDGEPIITLNGTNNIYADTGDCAVEYKVSVEQYVSNHSGGGGAKSLGGVFLGSSNSGSEEEPTEESEDTEKTKEIDEPKEEIKTIGDEPISKKRGGE